MTDQPISTDEAQPDGDQPAHVGGDVRADNVEIVQGGANTIEAHSVRIEQGGAARVRADEFSISNGGVALARAQRLTLNEGASALAVMTDSAHVSEGANVLLLFSRSTSGTVRPLLDWRAAAALGGAFALVLSVLRRGR